MSSQDVSKEQVLGHLRAWKDGGTKLLLGFTGPYKDFTIQVDVFGVAEDNSTVAFRWLLFQSDSDGVFVDSEGLFKISLEGASFSLAYEPERLTICRGQFRCALTVIRATAF